MIKIPKDFTLLEVGKPFNLIKNKSYLKQDGAVLELLEGEGKGHWFLLICLSNMSETEEQELHYPKITVRLIKESESFILPILRYEQMQFSIVFDPTIYKDARKELLFDMTKISNMITIVGIETTTNTIKTLRYANMPKRLYIALMQQYDDANKIRGFSRKFNNWINDLYNRYSDQELWEMAVYIGKMGEY